MEQIPSGVTGAVPQGAVGTGVSSSGISSWPQTLQSLCQERTPLPAHSSRKGHQQPVPVVCPAAAGQQLCGTAKVLSGVEKFSDF